MGSQDKAIENILRALADLGYSPPAGGGDAIEQLIRGELLYGVDAAFVSGRALSTVSRWAKEADEEGAPIAIKAGTAWLFVTRRLLDLIERTNAPNGRYARSEAETKHRKLLEMRAHSQTALSNESRRAACNATVCDRSGGKLKTVRDQPFREARRRETE